MFMPEKITAIDEMYREVGYIYNRHYRKNGRSRRYILLPKEIVSWTAENYGKNKQSAIRIVARGRFSYKN